MNLKNLSFGKEFTFNQMTPFLVAPTKNICYNRPIEIYPIIGTHVGLFPSQVYISEQDFIPYV